MQPKLNEVLLWIAATATYGVGDSLTTFLSLSWGCRDLNPLVTQQSFLPIKILTFFSLFFIYLRIRSVFIPLLLTVLGFIAMFNNLTLA